MLANLCLGDRDLQTILHSNTERFVKKGTVAHRNQISPFGDQLKESSRQCVMTRSLIKTELKFFFIISSFFFGFWSSGTIRLLINCLAQNILMHPK
jgi:hypothetical protein